MLTSFPGLGDTAAPVHGAAGPAKSGATAAHGLDGVFAALMLGVQASQGAQGAPGEPVAQGAPGPTGAPLPDALDAPDAPGTDARDLAARTVGITRFLASLRMPPTSTNQAASPGKAAASSAGTEPTAAPADASTGEDRSAPVIVVAPELQVAQVVPVVQVAQTVPVVQVAQVEQVAPAAQVPQVAQTVPVAQGAQTAQVAPDIVAVQGRPNAESAPVAQGAPAVQGAQVVQGAQAVQGEQAVQGAQTAPAAPDIVVGPGKPSAESAPASPPASAAQKLQNAIAAPPQQGAMETPAASAAPLRATRDTAVPPSVSAPAQSGVPGAPVTPAAATAQLESGAPPPAVAPAGPTVSQAKQPADATATGRPDISTTSARGYAQPRVVAQSTAGADANAAASKVKVALTPADAAPLRLERAVIASRVMAPVPVLPHTAPAVAAAVVSLPAPSAGIADSALGSQIVQSLRMQWAQGGGEATIELNPNFLGRVQVSVRVDRGVVSASVQADTTVVREWVAAHRDDLTQTLAQQGLRLDKLEIAQAPKEQPARDGARDPRHADRDASRHRRDDGALDADTFDAQVPQELLDDTPRSGEPR